MIKKLFSKIFGSSARNKKPPIDHLDHRENAGSLESVGDPGTVDGMDPESAAQAALINSSPIQETMAALEALADEIHHEDSHQMSAEEMCGITPGMPPGEIKAQLAALYRRYNRSASSLNGSLREEAETMLNAIVQVRENMAARE